MTWGPLARSTARPVCAAPGHPAHWHVTQLALVSVVADSRVVRTPDSKELLASLRVQEHTSDLETKAVALVIAVCNDLHPADSGQRIASGTAEDPFQLEPQSPTRRPASAIGAKLLWILASLS